MMRQDLRGQSRVRYDWISRVIIAVATVSSLVLAVMGAFNLQTLTVFAILIGGSVVLRVFVQIRKVKKDTNLSKGEQENVLKWVLIGLFALEIGNLAYPGLYSPPVSGSAVPLGLTVSLVTFASAFTLLTWENVFFFGEWLDIFLSLPYPRTEGRREISFVKSLVGPIGIPSAALLFTGLHYWHYGQSDPSALILVFLGGLVMAAGVFASGLWLTAWIVHFVNNFFQMPFGQYLLLIILGFAVYFYLRHRKSKGGVNWGRGRSTWSGRGGKGRW